EFACLNPAPFFSEELEITDGASVTFRYGVGIADGAGEDVLPGLAHDVRGVLVATAEPLRWVVGVGRVVDHDDGRRCRSVVVAARE
ncbi:hypothetical protein ACC691_39735, partial [Rhizobium johnstonii]|uniref:hypothetical protein n=1 Tax=Rhizobium johnstonii TaxID=3019933 RepID=UPI003F94EF65